MRVPVFATKFFRAFPGNPKPTPTHYIELAQALANSYRSDAHTAAYSNPETPYRLDTSLLRDPLNKDTIPQQGVQMVLFLGDVDCPEAHGPTRKRSATPEAWRTREREKLRELEREHPQPYSYIMRGGWRFAYALSRIIELHDDNDAQRWASLYRAWGSYLQRRFEIKIDRGCSDFSRLFRLPHTTRDRGGRPENLPVYGNPCNIGTWICEPSPEDIAAAMAGPTRSRAPRQQPPSIMTPTGQDARVSVLGLSLEIMGLLGPALADGRRTVTCLWADQHTTPSKVKDTLLYPPTPGNKWGFVYCFHNHCRTRTLGDVLRKIPRTVLDRAKMQLHSIALNKRIAPAKDRNDKELDELEELPDTNMKGRSL